MLVVEDDPLVVRMLERTFKKLVPDLRCEPNAPSAIETLAKEKFDVVWTDLDLGVGGDGIDVLVAASETQPDALLMVVTGNIHLVAKRAPPLGTRVFAKTEVAAAVACVREHAATLASKSP